MELGRRHWLAAFAGALLLHALAAGAWLWQAPPSGAVSAGMGGVSVSLGPAGGAPGALAAEVEATEEAEAVETAQTATESTAEPLEAEPAEPLETALLEPEAAQPVEKAAREPVEPQPDPVAELAEVPAVEPEPEKMEAVEPEKIEPKKTEPLEQVAAVVPPPPPKPRDLPPAATPVRRPPAAPAESVAEPREPPVQTAATVGAGGRSGTQAAPDAGTSEVNSSGGGLPGARADYLSLLQAWLEKHKEYPRRAQARRQEGTVLLQFVMDRHGQVLEFRIARSSGHGLLDKEVEEMIRRAEPLPPMPQEMQQARLELVVPVQFLLR